MKTLVGTPDPEQGPQQQWPTISVTSTSSADISVSASFGTLVSTGNHTYRWTA